MKNFVLLSLAFLVGCSSVGHNFDRRNVAKIVIGETTEAQLIKYFGQPQERGYNSDHQTILIWFYKQSNAKPAAVVPVVGAFAGTDAKDKCLVTRLNPIGKTIYFEYMTGSFDAGPGYERDPEAPIYPAKPASQRH